MTDITYQRVGEDDFRIYEDGHYVGDVFLHENILRPGTFVFIVHIESDWRGPRRVHDPRRVRGEVRRMLDTHPLF